MKKGKDMAQALMAQHCIALFVDWQERLFPAMPEGIRDRALKHACNLRWMAGEVGCPALFSEQYPRGLGHSLEALGAENAVDKILVDLRKLQLLDAVKAFDEMRLDGLRRACLSEDLE